MKVRVVVVFIFLALCVVEGKAKFYDLIDESGINFKHINGMTGEFHMVEVIGSGAAFFDYDNDGDMDLYIVQGGFLPGSKLAKTKYQDRLYRNDTVASGKPIFVDVTKQAKLNAFGYGMGVATADFNNDGFVDIYLANYGSNQLIMNQGDGTFVTTKNVGGADDKNWSISISIADENRDGYLDIFVVNYVDYPIRNGIKKCKAYDGSLDYCSPQAFQYQSDSLFKNNKDGTFTNISAKSGLTSLFAPGLGVVSADFNKDLLPDYYVANDGVENHLWINNGGDEFVEYALISGVAVNMNGEPEASMGVDAADYDNDGDIDLFMTHLSKQTNTLYVNNGKGWFSDLTVKMKLGSSSFNATGFGTLWFDYNNDGLYDIFSANGAIAKIESLMRKKDPYPFKQKNQLWKNTGDGAYVETSDEQDKSFGTLGVSRGAAFADIDNDGDLDIFVANNNGKPQFLINNEVSNNWIGFSVINPKLKRSEFGAQVSITQGKKTYNKKVKTDGGFESSHDDRVIFGLGGVNASVDVQVTWLDGSKTKFKDLSVNKYHVLKKN